MSNRAYSNFFVYPVVARLAALVALALLFIPGAMAAALLGIGVALVIGVVVLIVGASLRRQAIPAVVIAAAIPETELDWPTPQIRSLPDALRKIDWFQFEKLVAAVYELEGYTVQPVGGAKPDGGVDLLIEKEGIKSVVQCKHWKHATIREKELREFLGTLTDTSISSGIFVTLRGFTKYAEAFAQKNRIVLVGEPGLTSMLEKANWKQNRRILTLLDDKRKYCPRCGRTMVRRTARKGWRAGQLFWGCSTYPRCNYILDA
jgi:restriction system protein